MNKIDEDEIMVSYKIIDDRCTDNFTLVDKKIDLTVRFGIFLCTCIVFIPYIVLCFYNSLTNKECSSNPISLNKYLIIAGIKMFINFVIISYNLISQSIYFDSKEMKYTNKIFNLFQIIDMMLNMFGVLIIYNHDNTPNCNDKIISFSIGYIALNFIINIGIFSEIVKEKLNKSG